MQRVLISTIAPVNGGIPTMTRFLARTLSAKGYVPVLAHYEPYSVSPHMSVPTLHLLQRRPLVEQRRTLDDYETYAIGAWLPELEFTNYLATATWKRLMDSCDAFVTVAGNALAALPFYQTGRPFVAWLAAGWKDDRKDRARQFAPSRRLFDRALVAPFAAWLEASILRSGSILALSQYSKDVLDAVAGTTRVESVLPMPIDATLFGPEPNARVPGRIGFCGRVNDPRKNIELLLESVARMRRTRPEVTALLIGDEPNAMLRRLVDKFEIGDAVEFLPYVSRERLRDGLRTFDVFVIPSYQEGLCIAALEAMACGCPVVSTRCGGAEEFVIPDETGFLVDFDTAEMADAALRIIADDVLRQRLAQGARAMVLQNYSSARAEAVFWGTFDRQFPIQAKAA